MSLRSARRPSSKPHQARSRRRAVALAALAGLPLVVGCEVDSYINPSITGRWENTPTIVPILERLGMVEDQSGELVEYSDVTPEDLVPDAEPYRLGAGDALRITLVDDITRGQQSEYDRTVDTRGFIDLPQLGQIQLAGLTVEQAREAMQASLGRLVSDPVVGLDVVQQRNQTFTVVGAVEQPGPFFLPRADYRLLEAITSAGRFQESVQYVYLIRQVALDESVTRGGIPPSRSSKSPESSGDGSTTPASDAADTPAAPSSPDDFLKTIDRLSQPEGSTGGATPPAEAPKAEPQSTEPQNAEPAPAPAPAAAPAEAPEPVVDLPDAAMAPKPAVFGRGYQPDTAPSREPMVDLPDSAGSGPANPEPVSGDASAPSSGNWVYVNGRWVQAARAGGEEAGNGGKNKGLLMTQRIIRIPSNALMAGDAKYNIVVRPGDVLRVPPPPNGVVYVDGQVQRPGVYNLPESGRLTLQRVITAAGGYGEQAIPERMDITRMLPGDRQAIVRLDGRAIAEGTQPDIYLKPDDRVNVGSNFWALPLAVIRNGFRMSYGFGFLIDRNFGNDIFGPPPENTNSGF